MGAVASAKAVYAAWQLQDLHALRALIHPAARLQTQAGGEGLLGREETIELLERVTRDGVYHAVVLEFVELDASAALLSGRVRYRHALGGFADDPRCWVYVFRDGLLYRSRLFPDEARARAAYAELGPGLGVPPDESEPRDAAASAPSARASRTPTTRSR